MDPFDIDMEFLRRLDAVRTGIGDLTEASADPVLDLLDAARERASADGLAAALLRLIAESWRAAEEADVSATSRLATTTIAALECVEQHSIAEDPESSEALVHQAAAAILRATGADQSEWHRLRTGRAVEEAPVGPAPPTTPGAGSHDVAAPDLDDIASALLSTDAEDRAGLAEALEAIRALADHSWVPSDSQDLIATSIEGLEYACSGARRSKKKTAVAREALDRLAQVLETLIDHRYAETRREDGPALEELAGEEAGARRQPEDAPFAPTIELVSPDDESAEEIEVVVRGATTFTLTDGTDPDLLEDFLAEGFDYLEQAEHALLALENDPTDAESINVVFRAFHTIKGVAGFLHLDPISSLSHHAESLLSSVREGEIVFNPPVADITLRSADKLRELLGATRVAHEGDTREVKIPSGFDALVTTLSDPDVLDRLARGVSVAPAPAQAEARMDDDGGPSAVTSEEGSVRVKTARLDRLLDLVGELVVSHAMVAEDPTILDDHQSDLARKVSRSEKILRELQDLTTSMRMVPLKPAFRKLARVVRDVSRRAGKPVELITDGEDTELDRSMVNIITDPLVHMARNAIDHGLESPEERVAAGKPEHGVVRLSAHQSGGSVVIEISDDGHGLDREKIAGKAIERGIIESDRGMSDEEVFNLVFAPGFSTAEKVTDISGRGVGMDVVRRSVESLRGRIDIRSTPGEGSCFSIHLPLTLAITDGMLIRVGSERYIIPTIKIQMSFRPEPKHLSKVTGRSEMVMLHGDLVPLIRMHEVYGIDDSERDPARGLLVIVGEGTRRSGLLVDELLGQQQFVVKALSGDVAEVPGIAGGTIMGDGSVGLILDPEEIISLWRSGPNGSKRSVA